jgi:NADPH-dependent curcumin reductase CurA
MISQYNSAPTGPRNIYGVIEKSITMQGFLGASHLGLWTDFQRDVTQWIVDGQIRWKETVVDGLENAPQAFLGIFAGDNFGKMLVKLSEKETSHG